MGAPGNIDRASQDRVAEWAWDPNVVEVATSLIVVPIRVSLSSQRCVLTIY